MPTMLDRDSANYNELRKKVDEETYPEIGRGDSSCCYAISDSQVVLVALVSAGNKASIEKSLNILHELERLDHIIESTDSGNAKYYIFQKRMPGNSLIDKFFPEADEIITDELKCLQLSIDIVEKVELLHSHQIMHGDLHPGNIMVSDNNEVSLIDFDWSVKINGKYTNTQSKPDGEHHCPHWKETQDASFAADIYSLGVLFNEGNCGGLLGLKLNEKLDSQILNDSGLGNILAQMRDEDPEKRPTLGDIKKGLNAAMDLVPNRKHQSRL